jgi:hypothetical protein
VENDINPIRLELQRTPLKRPEKFDSVTDFIFFCGNLNLHGPQNPSALLQFLEPALDIHNLLSDWVQWLPEEYS